MTTLRVYQAALAGQTFKLRVYDVSIKAVTSYIRVYGVSMTKAEVATPTATTPINAESLSTVTLTATHPDTVDTWTWTADPANSHTVSLTGTGASRTFRAPATINGTTLKFWVTATVGGIVSTAVQVTVTVNAHAVWVKQASGFTDTAGWAPYLVQIIP